MGEVVAHDGARPPAPGVLLDELRDSEARYRALVLASSQMVWRTDPQGDVLDNTPAWQDATGQAQEQSNGWGWLDVVHPDDRPGVVEHWRGCLRDRVPYEREYRIRVDGAWRWVLARAVPVRGQDGEVREWIGTSIDVDDAHRAAQERDALLADLRSAVERTTVLQALTADLAGTQATAEVADVVCRHLREVLGAGAGSMHLSDPAGVLRMVASFGYPPHVSRRFAAVDRNSRLPVAVAFSTGTALFLGEGAAGQPGQDVGRVLPEPGSAGVAVLPLIAGARAIGTVTVEPPEGGSFDDGAYAVLVALTTQAAQALERARVVERLREVTADLQQGLAPAEVPAVAGLDVGAVYRAGGDAVELVGGDWYDVLPLDEGRVALVMGDVMGRGVHAATTMAAVSAAVRAYSLVEPDPETLLQRLDAFVERHAPEQFVTLFYGLLDTSSGRLEFMLAGHLPPFVLGEEAVSVHRGDAGQPLGLSGRRPLHTLRLAPGEGLVILTDGAVEQRGLSLDDGISRAAQAARGHASATATAAAVAGSSPAGAEHDDVTVLVVRRPLLF